MRGKVLRHRVTLEAPPATRDGQGQLTGAWTEIATMWADCEALGTREMHAAGQEQQSVSLRVVIRHRDGITSAMRLRWRGVLYDIGGDPMPDATRQWLTIMCGSGVRDAR